ncbi:MAG: beta-ketoacyl-ACP synthase II [Bacteroidales bacterium]|nr:beta-ketoacyl-ACP synthase II [Bacteroidales bacterium]
MDRVVITGLGTVNPLGNNVSEYFNNLDKGVSGASLISVVDASKFTTKFACEIKGFDLTNFGYTRKDINKNDRYAQFALVAADEAIADSGVNLDEEDRDRIGVIFGSGVGGISTLTEEMKDYTETEMPKFSPFLIPKFVLNLASGQIAIKHGLMGPNFAISSACATSSNSIAVAAQLIQMGKADMMVTGGSEAPICIPGMGGFCSMRAMSVNNEEYMTASRPFDKTRDGFVIGEGAGALVLESLTHAKARGARIYAELAGCGMSADAYHMSAPLPDGSGAAKAILQSLKEAGVKPEEVDYINVHATSTPLGDVSELNAIKSVFGKFAYKVNISATKSMTGHLLGAAGAIEALACVHAINSGVIPPTINFKVPDPDIDYDMNLTLNKAQRRDVRVAISNNFGFGGQNGCLTLKRFEN